ncbi:helix-turn-helix domain-containing protein [Capnocytophaga canimorsus]|uniref:helix-turn-helix domain-containing protein n=1 Tax=Capnocytophaga canimorsus TaxID=28188 RepID=UPI0037CFBB9D
MKNNNDNQNSYINSYLVDAFDKLGKSQKEVINDLGKSQPYVSALMSGKKIVGKDIAKELANLYGFDEGSILTGKMLNTHTQEEDFEDEENFLRTEREKYGLSLVDISKKMNIPLKKLKEYDTGEKNIPKKTLEILEQFFEQAAKEYEVYEQEDTSIPVLQTETMISSVQVPYYDVDFAGGWTSAELFSQQKPSFVISSPDFARAEFACNLIGNSISNRIENGSIIGLRKVDEWQIYFPTNEIYGVVTKNGLRTVKIVKRSKEKGFLELIPDALPQFNNPPYEPELIPIDYVVEFYQVTAWAYFERLAM